MQHNAESEADARRAFAESIIARYPNVQPHELAAVLRYLRKQASPHDRSLIVSNAELAARYRQLSEDHHLNRLRPLEWAMVVLGFTVLVLLIYLMAALAGAM